MRGADRTAPAPRVALAAAGAIAAGVLAGCSAGTPEPVTKPPYTVETIRSGFVGAADLGEGAIAFEDDDHASHTIYTPPNSIPTCPYVQRSDDVQVPVEAAVEPVGGNPTGRFIVAPPKVGPQTLPVVTQGAVVFESTTLAGNAMNAVTAESAKCPATFTILGGPPSIVGAYTTGSRPLELNGWRGFAQHLVHTPPAGLGSDTYDDLVTVVVHKANAVLYVGYTQIKNVGERSDTEEKVKDLMTTTLARLG